MTIPPTWHAAVSFAARAHRGQLRKDGETPYVAHPVRVAMIVAMIFECRDEATVTAALLHDTIEDCAVDYDDIDGEFGREIADIVACLTKDMRLVEEEREEAYDVQLKGGPWQARLVKLADVYDNLCDATSDSMRRSQVRKARRAITVAGDEEAIRRAVRILEELLQAMGEG